LWLVDDAVPVVHCNVDDLPAANQLLQLCGDWIPGGALVAAVLRRSPREDIFLAEHDGYVKGVSSRTGEGRYWRGTLADFAGDWDACESAGHTHYAIRASTPTVYQRLELGGDWIPGGALVAAVLRWSPREDIYLAEHDGYVKGVSSRTGEGRYWRGTLTDFAGDWDACESAGYTHYAIRSRALAPA
jgi:hypothetical protein